MHVCYVHIEVSWIMNDDEYVSLNRGRERESGTHHLRELMDVIHNLFTCM